MDSRDGLSTQEQNLVIFILALSSFMASLDATIVNISLPAIAGSFHIPLSSVSWVAMSYLLVLSGFLLVFGRLGDMHGFRRIFLFGFATFTLGSLLCGLASGIEVLIGSRLVQGIGAAALEAIGPAMVAIYLPRESRGRALGILATAISLGVAAGPILGGFLTGYASWHWIFFINVPVGIAALCLGRRYLPANRPVAQAGLFDAPGAVLLFLALATFLWPVSEGLTLGWTSLPVLLSFCCSGILWILFVRREMRCPDPLLDLTLFRHRDFLAACLAAGCMMLVIAGTEFLLPFFFEGVAGIPPAGAGLLLAIPSVAILLFGPVSGSLSDRHGSRILATGASVLTALALVLISLYTDTTGLPYVVTTLLIAGVAFGIFFPPNMNQVLGQSRKDGEGAGSAIMTTIKNVGGTLGVALTGTIAVMTVTGSRGFDPATPVAEIPISVLVDGYHAAILTMAGIAILAVLFSAIARDPPDGTGESAETGSVELPGN